MLRNSLFYFLILGTGISFFLTYTYFFGVSKNDYETLDKEFYSNNSTLVYNQQTKFRAKVLKEYKSKVNSFFINQGKSDSLILNKIKTKVIVDFLIPKTKSKYSINLKNYKIPPAFLISYDTLYLTYTIDNEKINNLIRNQDFTIQSFEEILKYRDYIKIKKNATYHLQITFWILFLVLLYIFILFVSYSDKFLKSKEDYLPFAKVYKNIKIEIDYILGLKSEISESVNEEDKEELQREYDVKIEDLINQIEDLAEKNKEQYIINEMVRKSELKLKECSNRANLMLISGLSMSFVGVTLFYYTIPELKGLKFDFIKMLSLSLRPTLILIFIQAISWYLLKQYRLTQEEYKHYFLIYNRKMNYLSTYKLIQSSNLNEEDDMKKLLPLILLKEDANVFLKDAENDKLIQASNSFIESLSEKIMNRFK